MLYFICFVISLLLLMYILSHENVIEVSFILLVIIVAIGNGGFYALSRSQNLEEAIIANNISYVIGIFAPVTVFRVVCSICRVHLKRIFMLIEYAIQILIYLSLFTIGRSGLFYKTVEYHTDPTVHLTKIYGPMHTAYFLTLIFYTLSSLIVGILSLQKKSKVSSSNVVIVIFVNLLVVGIYIIERLTRIPYELMPVAYVISLFIFMVPLLKIYAFSVYDNKNILEKQIERTAYIIFDKKKKYMGCNDYATSLFPELETWELDKKIPGSGGRFNTFLRQPLMNYIHTSVGEQVTSGSYEYREKQYHYDIEKLHAYGGRSKGYIIQVSPGYYSKKI